MKISELLNPQDTNPSPALFENFKEFTGKFQFQLPSSVCNTAQDPTNNNNVNNNKPNVDNNCENHMANPLSIEIQQVPVQKRVPTTTTTLKNRGRKGPCLRFHQAERLHRRLDTVEDEESQRWLLLHQLSSLFGRTISNTKRSLKAKGVGLRKANKEERIFLIQHERASFRSRSIVFVHRGDAEPYIEQLLGKALSKHETPFVFKFSVNGNFTNNGNNSNGESSILLLSTQISNTNNNISISNSNSNYCSSAPGSYQASFPPAKFPSYISETCQSSILPGLHIPFPTRAIPANHHTHQISFPSGFQAPITKVNKFVSE